MARDLVDLPDLADLGLTTTREPPAALSRQSALPEKITDRTRAQLPAIYTKAIDSIRAFESIDHCIMAEAQADGWEVTAKKLHDGELLRVAVRVKMRAIRRCGQLLNAEPEARGGDQSKEDGTVPFAKGKQALANRHELTERERKRAIRFAAIPDELFEEVVEDPFQLPTFEGLEQLGKNALGHKRRKTRNAAIGEGLGEDEFAEGSVELLLADPPWRYEHPPVGASSRSIENHYPTLDLDEICAVKVGAAELPVFSLAAPDAVLFLWATAPKLAECFEVITAWGFVYRTCMVWDKMKIGMGYHVRNQHELLLIAKRGEVRPPLPKDRPSSVLRAKRGKHSEKPEAIYRIVEKMYPDLRKLEMFARGKRKGWWSWGLEVGPAEEVTAEAAE